MATERVCDYGDGESCAVGNTVADMTHVGELLSALEGKILGSVTPAEREAFIVQAAALERQFRDLNAKITKEACSRCLYKYYK